MEAIIINPIGIIHTPHQSSSDAPIQPVYSEKAGGEVEVFDCYREGLSDISEFERIWLIFWCHLAKPYRLKVIPYRDTVERGVFACRAPSRPNSIGLSVVKLQDVDYNRGILTVEGVDMLDNTPLIDIKPYVPKFDSFQSSVSGWLERSSSQTTKSDNRFCK